MRKLTYVGINGKQTVETASYFEMLELKKQGFKFTEELRDLKEDRNNTRAKKLEGKVFKNHYNPPYVTADALN